LAAAELMSCASSPNRPSVEAFAHALVGSRRSRPPPLPMRYPLNSTPDSSGKSVDDSEFLEMTQQDPVQARILRQSLEHLASGLGGDTLKEMAREVLSGRMGLREAANVSAYAEQAVEQSAPLAEKWASMSDSEREALAMDGQRRLEEERRQLDEERRAESESRSGSKGRHDGRGWSLY
jgi:hypothetical protein